MNYTGEHKIPANSSEPDRLADARVAFVHNFAPYYRKKVFQALSTMCNVEFLFYSDGAEWYWPKAHGVTEIGFRSRYFPGFWIGRTRIAFGLIPALLFGRFNVFIKCINGRFAVPVTYLFARIRRAPFILWTGVWHRLGTRSHRWMFPITRYLYRNSDAVVVYGDHVKRYLVSEGVDPDRIFVAWQSVNNAQYRRIVSDEEQRELRARYNLPQEKKIVLYLGRLVKDKGLDYLLEAFARLERQDALLLICGTGPEEEHLRALVQRLGMQNRVRFTGHVKSTDAILFYSLAWVAVLPSITTPVFREPWGLTVNETFNQGVPVIASDAVGAAAGGLVQSGRNGFVVPERDAGALHTALETVLGNPDLRMRMGQNAANDILSWTQERQAEGYRDAVAYVMARSKEMRKRG